MKKLESIKKHQSESKVADIIKNTVKENTSIGVHSRFWTKYLLASQFSEVLVKRHLIDKHIMITSRDVKYEQEEEIMLVRSLIPRKDARKPIKYLKEHYAQIPLFQGFPISSEESEMLHNISKEEALKAIESLRKISDLLVEEGIYPLRIAMVAHSSPGLYNSFKRVKNP